LLLSAGLFDAGTEGVVGAPVSVGAFLVFFFFADLDSDLTAGFWVTEAAIMRGDDGSREREVKRERESAL
jgi:hypothetical protein